ncbi:hypothetical protein SASPL_126858 [Salvia splendens]|uniref:Eukaryotic translation initiation factor 3 subunit E n=1 Tax=Salvia splendens TaxID=180675 RepID=A0A8X8XL88_SALSN|nr:hypothetical protein SASPL_126858 [Salvia splendens]
MASKFDLTPRIAPNLDRHLVFPLLEFLQERGLYPEEDILKAKIELLNHTNMVDYAMDIHKSLYRSDDVPQDMIDRRAEVVGRLKVLEDGCSFDWISAESSSNVVYLQVIGPEQIDALYDYAKFQFECGNYSGAADYLHQYRALCTNNDKSLSALWGKLAAEVLMQNWDIALEELNHLKEIIDSKVVWYLSAIQTNAPHLLRYLATAFIVNKRRRPQFKEFIKVIQPEQYSHDDPITEFLACIYVNYDFDGAQKKMRECEEAILNDPFLGKRIEEGNFTTVPLRDEFLENARLFIFETYCRIHQRIDMGVLAEKLNLNYEEAERWIVNLIRTSKLEARIDSKLGTIIMEPNDTNVYEQLINHTTALSNRTYKIVHQLLENAPAQTAR